MRVMVVFRNDDLSACSEVEHERRITDIFDQYNAKQTIGVIPLCCDGDPRDRGLQRQVPLQENPRIAAFLCEYLARSGSEIALHGCTHQTNRFSRPSRREYYEFEGLDLEEQEELIARGTRALVESAGIRPYTFIPPWNRLDWNTVYACSKQGYRIVSAGPFAPVVDGIMSLGVNCTLESFPSLFESAQTTQHPVLLTVMYHSRFLTTENDVTLLKKAVGLAVCSPHSQVLTLAETVQCYPELVQENNAAAMNVVPQWMVSSTDRSRVMIYQRVVCKLGLQNALLQTYSSAHTLYWQGKYKECSSLSPLIDRLCRRSLMLGRLAAAACGLAIGVLVWAVCARHHLFSRMCWYVGMVAVMGMLGTATTWLLTDKDAKRESALSTRLSLLAAIGGVGVGECISLIVSGMVSGNSPGVE